MSYNDHTQSQLSLPTSGRFDWIDGKNELVFQKYANQKPPKAIYSRRNFHKNVPIKSEKEVRIITIQDIKSVALARLKSSGKRFHYSQHFVQMIRSPECDRLLVHLARYLDCYFNILQSKEKFASEKLLPNLNQLKEQKELHIRLDTLKYNFSLSYAKFLLHERIRIHSTNPRPIDPVTYAKTDQDLYETFFWFFVFCMWITFQRVRFQEICIQIGWFTRSEMFNSLGRQGASFFGLKETDSKGTNKIYETHLPRASMLNKCSPALRLLLDDTSKIHSDETGEKQRKAQDLTEIHSGEGIERIGILGDYRHLYDDQLISNKQTDESDPVQNEDRNENTEEVEQEENDK
ncbi:unnamed protein product [Trichobilharzia szidati]|nr:unnamed protein product [Trichobilharzia szidati]